MAKKERGIRNNDNRAASIEQTGPPEGQGLGHSLYIVQPHVCQQGDVLLPSPLYQPVGVNAPTLPMWPKGKGRSRFPRVQPAYELNPLVLHRGGHPSRTRTAG